MQFNFLKRISVLALVVVMFASCAPTIIDYSMTTVPEESGLNFVQYTEDNDNAVGPGIREVSGIIRWYAPALIGISPDGERIAYNGYKDNTNNIFIKSTSGGGAINQRTFRNNVLDMSFSPDGEHIAFTDVTNQGSEIKLIGASSGASIQQITTGYNDVGPRFSPDGNKIFFTRETQRRGSDGRIYSSFVIWSYNLETSLFTQYSQGFTPNVSPDGETLIVTRNNRDTNRGEIWSINIETGQETLILSDENRGFSSPQISPDGERLIIVGSTQKTEDRPANLDLYTVRMNGTGLTQHTFHPGHDVSPVWSPDGEHIFFLSQRGSEEGEFNVWRMNMR